MLVKRLAEQNEGQALGVSVMLQFLPMLVLGAWAGALADQRNRRRLTIATQSVLAIQALTLTVVDFSGHASLPIVYALTLVLGIASAIDNPARRGLVLELVDKANISNAMSINTATMTGSRVFGPALGMAGDLVRNGVVLPRQRLVLRGRDRRPVVDGPDQTADRTTSAAPHGRCAKDWRSSGRTNGCA
ncbi:MAG: MFS transporter [Ilumatobacteraceae bacterium]